MPCFFFIFLVACNCYCSLALPQCAMGWSVHILLERKFVIVVTRLEYSDVTCHVVLLYSVNWTKIGISFIFPTVNLFRY